MTEIEIDIKTSLEEIEDNLDKYIASAISNNQKIHITSPVGSGKTTYALKLIDKYKDEYQFIVLEPLISITSQLYKNFANYDSTPFIYNSKKAEELEEWEGTFEAKWPGPFLSTIDSAWKLIENDKVDISKTVVIIDESHAFLTDTRDSFDHTVNAILEAGVPVIGLSATASSWVLNYLFKMDMEIKISTTGIPTKEIYHLVERRIPKVIAYLIRESEMNKGVIWTEVIEDQYNIRDAIEKFNPKLDVRVLNADTRDNEESELWEYLISNHELPSYVNVAIMNKVVQAGININNDDLDFQFLFGRFDPIGFQQYIGRCRNYKNEYVYLHYNYGEEDDWDDDDERYEYVGFLNNKLKDITDTIVPNKFNIPAGQEQFYSKRTNGKGYILNRTKYANAVYGKLRKLHGRNVLKIVQKQDPTLKIIFDGTITDKIHTLIDKEEREEQKEFRNTVIPGVVQTNHNDFISLIEYYDTAMTITEIEELVNNSYANLRKAKKSNKLHIPITRKESMIKALSTINKSNVSILRMMVASKAYVDRNKDENLLCDVLDTDVIKNQSITKAFRALTYYLTIYPKYKRIIDKKVLVMLKANLDGSNNKDKNKTKAEWIAEIHSNLITTRQLPTVLAEKIYSYHLKLIKGSKVDQNMGKRVTSYRITQVIDTYDAYIKSGGIY
ncbi:MAG: DEAD/DEAH box helicase family protein [Candidatus Marithrix sp.]